MGVLQMRVEVRLARPVFVEEKFPRIVRRNMQIVVEAARFLARRRDEADQGFPQFRLLTRLGLKRGDDG